MKKKVNKEAIVIGLVIIFIVLFQVSNTSYSISNNSNSIKLVNKILDNNTIYNKDDNIEDGLLLDDEYYFKGNVNNNYVSLNNELWRIVSLKDNYIKIIKEEGINNNKLYKYSDDYNEGDYLDSNIYKILDEWYKEELINYDSYILKYNYCVLYKNKECKDNKLLKIGILNYDDVVKAGGIKNINNDTYYLFNNNEWWILNSSYDVLIGSYFSSYVNNLGSIEDGFVDEEKTIRPVIVLNNITYKTGDGTIDNPYVIE